MKDTPKHSFEDEFRKAFEDAEATPSPKLWAQIDAELANKEASIYKRKLYIYKLRVAAAAIIVFGFMGIWLLNSQFSDNTLVELPQAMDKQQTNRQAANSTVGHGEISVANSPTSTSAPVHSPVNSQPQNSLESTTTQMGSEQKLASEKMKQAPESNSGKILEQPTIPKNPETIALNANKEITSNSTSKKSQEKAPVTYSDPSVSNKKPESIVRQEPALARTAPAINSQLPSETEKKQALLSGNVNTDRTDLANNASVTNQMNSRQNDPAAGNFSAYVISRIDKHIQPLDNAVVLQAPRVTIKPNHHVWIEEEKEIGGGRSASRWAVGLSFAPSQFNPNMQVNPQASATLSNARNTYYNRTAVPVPVNTLNTLQTNTSVGKELEQAENINLSYNVGVDVGYALSEKFSLHSGLLYLHNNSQITTDNYLQNINSQEKYPEFMALIEPSVSSHYRNKFKYDNAPAPVNAPNTNGFQNIEMAMADKYATSYPGVTEVLVYNTYQYLSIPLRLHYKLLDKKVSTDIGAGLSADLFMKNTIGNPEENIANQEFNRSDNGPYRDMSFSGLVSAKINYKVSSKYSVYIQPSYRAALNSITNSALVSSRPHSFGIGTGFQYRF